MLSVAITQIPELDLSEVATLLNKIFLIFPNYALGMGVVQLSSNYQLQQQCASFNLEFLCPAFPKSFCCAKCKQGLIRKDTCICCIRSYGIHFNCYVWFLQ